MIESVNPKFLGWPKICGHAYSNPNSSPIANADHTKTILRKLDNFLSCGFISDLIKSYSREPACSPSAFLDNCTGHALNALIGDESESMHKRERVFMGNTKEGKSMYKWVEGGNQRELHDAIVQAYIDSGLIWGFLPSTYAPTPIQQQTEPQEAERITTPFDSFAREWLERFVHGVKSETYTILN